MRIASVFLITALVSISSITLQAIDPGQAYLPPEKVDVEIGKTKILELPFAIQEHESESPNIKVVNVENNQLTVEGTVPGNATVSLVGNNIRKVFHITVTGSLAPTYQALQREISNIRGISATLTEKTILLQGVISSVREWEYFKRVLRFYERSCTNHVRFHPGPELFELLKKDFAAAGLPVVEKISPAAPGKIQFALDGDVFTVSGFLLCQEDITRVENILSVQKWLDPAWNGNALQLKKDLRLSDCQFDVNVVFVGISKNQLERMGNTQADGTIISWNFVAWIRELVGKAADGQVFDTHKAGFHTSLNTDIKGALAFFGENGISDFRDAGHLTITNNNPAAAEFENGGTLQVKVASQESADLKPIEFGLKMKISGGFVRQNELLLKLDLEKSLAPVKQDGDYFQRSTKTKTQIRCVPGQTVILAGQKENVYTGQGPSGYAYLRHAPILNWFFAHEDELITEMYYLILICPQMKKAAPDMLAPPADATIHLEKKVQERIREREEKIRAEEEKNWFMKMFSW